MTYYVVRTNGTIETRECAPIMAMESIKKAIGADIIDTVNLKDGRVMIVDDQGHPKGRPLNPNATRLYWAVCRRGTFHEMRGDTAVCNDVDFDNSTHVTGFRAKELAPPAPPVIPDNGKSVEPTPYMVHCPVHGAVYLTDKEYERQMFAVDSRWVCPVCLVLAPWDDENYERYTEQAPPAPTRPDDPPGIAESDPPSMVSSWPGRRRE